jgi:hypothetical protein
MRPILGLLLVGLLALPALSAPVGAQVGAAAPPAWGSVSAPLRPGAEAQTAEGQCTYNFLFYDASNAYVGTAAHCTDKLNEVARLGNGQRVGVVVYDSDRVAGASAVDFSLIRLDTAMIAQANPKMLGNVHGPTGSVTHADLRVGEPVAFYGYGLVLGELAPTRPREGVLVTFSTTMYQADMPAVNGDSGAPILEKETGKALGIVSHYGTYTTDEGPLMSFVLDELRRAGFTVTLATV